MNITHRVSAIGALVVAVIVMAGSVASSWAGTAEVRLKTRLAGGAIEGVVPSGSADYRERGTRKQFSVQVEDVKLLAGTVLNVTVNGGPVGMITLAAPVVGALPGGDLDLNTQDGERVPMVKKGDVIVVTHGGVAILSGAL
jgi:hypothetical protein